MVIEALWMSAWMLALAVPVLTGVDPESHSEPSLSSMATLTSVAATPSIAAAVAATSGPIIGTPVVLDGDTLAFGTVRVRLHGVDAFEAEQTCTVAGRTDACGGRATRYLAGLVRGGLVACERRDVDRYGRIVAVCRAGGVDLGAAMVRAGHAVAYRRYSSDYAALEDGARAAKAGAWKGSFAMPAEHRTRGNAGTASVAAAQQTDAAGADGCSIKGNINRRGERIYHVRGDPYYGPTRPEAMFCSSRQAEQAGFRRAGRPRR